MTIPLLTAQPSEPAKSQTASGKPRSETREPASGRSEDKDFAAAMSEGASKDAARPGTASGPELTKRDATPETPTAAADADGDARQAGALADKELAMPDEAGIAADLPDTAPTDVPRRRVTIPDLPSRRATTDPSGPQSTDVSRTPEAQPLPDADMARAGSEHARISELPGPAQPAQPAAARVVIAPPAATQAATAVAQPETMTRPANGQTAVDENALAPARTAQMTAPTDARVAGASNPVSRVVHAKPLARAANEVATEDRGARRSHDAVSRAIETVAATPAAPPTPPAGVAQTAVAGQMSILQPATRDALSTKEKAEALLSLDGETESLRFDMRGSSGSTSTQPGSFATAMTRADLPRGVAMQIGEMVRAMPDRPVDVSLSPEELGRVRLSISTGEGGVTLNILAERPETLDLMRRHADMLARELADLGFASIDLSFGKGDDTESGDGEGRGDGNRHAGRATDDIDAAATPDGPVNRLTLGPTGGLDIRI